MTWRFSDGTTVHLGGNVEGASLFAQEIRADMEAGRAIVMMEAIPGDEVPLDPSNASMLDRWLRDELQRPWRRELRLTEAPEVEPLPEPPPEPERPEDEEWVH